MVLPCRPKGGKADQVRQDACNTVLQNGRIDAHAEKAKKCADHGDDRGDFS
jgi:hypothetical protein